MTDYPTLPVKFPEKETFLRLGGHLTKTGMRPDERNSYLQTAREAFDAGEFRGRWEIFPVAGIRKEGITLDNGTFIPSADFTARCSGITHLWCGAVTAGAKILREKELREKISEKAIFDAVASESADAAMDQLQILAAAELRRRGMTLAARRFSPGYGDMPLDVQKFCFELLRLAEIGISLSETFYMTPEKSVTAFAGVW